MTAEEGLSAQRPLEVFNAGIGANLISSRSPAYATSGKPESRIIQCRDDR